MGIGGITTNINGTSQSVVSNITYRGDAIHGSTNVADAGRIGATNGTETINDRSYIYDKLDRLTSDGVGEDDPMTYGYDQNDNRQTRKQGTGTDSIDEFIYYMEGSNRINRRSIVKRGTRQVALMPARTMTYSDTGRLYQLTQAGTLKAEYIYNERHS